MIDASCPDCQASYSLPETQAGKRVRCKKCGGTFAVKASEEPVVLEAAEELPEASSRLRSGPPPRRRDEDEDRPARRRDRDRDDDDDEEEDDRDRPRQGGNMGLILALSLGGLLVLGGLGGTIAYVVAKSGTSPAGPVAENKPDEKKPEENANPFPANPFPANPFGGNVGGNNGNPPPFDPPVFKPPVVQKPVVKTVADALEALRDAEENRKREGLAFLEKAPRDEARLAEVVQAVKPFFRDPNLRGNAIKVAGQWTAPQMRDELLALSNETDAFLIWSVLENLGSYDDEKVIETVAKHLLNIHHKSAAAKALRKIGKKAEKHVLPLLYSKDPFARGEAESLLAAFGTTDEAKRAQTVKDLSREDGVDHDLIVKYFLKRKPDPERPEEQAAVSKGLEGLMNDRNPFLKEEIWRTMEHWATPESVPALAKALAERGFGKKDPLIAALARIKDEPALVALRDLLGNKSHRDAAAKALIAIGPKAEPLVLPLLKSTIPAVASAGIVVLSEVGGADTAKALDALFKRLPARDGRGRAFVKAALDKVKARLR